MAPAPRHGFTLMEIMIALVVFSMLSVGAFSVLTQLQRSQAELEERSARLETLQRLRLIAWHDLGQASPRIPPMHTDALASVTVMPPGALVFTSSHWPNPMQEERSTLAVVRYATENGTLERQVWPFTASPNALPALRQVLADHVENASFRTIAPAAQKSPFPAAIEMRMVLPPFGEITQLVPLVQKP